MHLSWGARIVIGFIALAVVVKFGLPYVQDASEGLFGGGDVGETDPSRVPVAKSEPGRSSLVSPQGREAGAKEREASPEMPADTELSDVRIAVIVEARYPLPSLLSFEEAVPDWSRLPEALLPKEVSLTEPATFREIDGDRLLGISVARKARPVAVSGDQLEVASLAVPDLTVSVAIATTNLAQEARDGYRAFAVREMEQVQAMRLQDRIALGAARDSRALQVLQDETWNPPEEPLLTALRDRIAAGEAGPVQLEQVRHYAFNGRQALDVGTFQGEYETVSVYFEIPTPFGVVGRRALAATWRGRFEAWVEKVDLPDFET